VASGITVHNPREVAAAASPGAPSADDATWRVGSESQAENASAETQGATVGAIRIIEMSKDSGTRRASATAAGVFVTKDPTPAPNNDAAALETSSSSDTHEHAGHDEGLVDRATWVQGRGVEHHADRPGGGTEFSVRSAVEQDLSGVERDQTDEATQDGRLASSVGPDQRCHGTPLDAEGHLVDDGPRAVRLAEAGHADERVGSHREATTTIIAMKNGTITRKLTAGQDPPGAR
jgi:hypothetical protein